MTANPLQRLRRVGTGRKLIFDIVQGCQSIAAFLRSARSGRECLQGLRMKRMQFRRAA